MGAYSKGGLICKIQLYGWGLIQKWRLNRSFTVNEDIVIYSMHYLNSDRERESVKVSDERNLPYFNAKYFFSVKF